MTVLERLKYIFNVPEDYNKKDIAEILDYYFEGCQTPKEFEEVLDDEA